MSVWPHKTKEDGTRQGNGSHCISQTRPDGCLLVMKQFLMYWDQGYGDETLIRPIFYKEFDGSLHDCMTWGLRSKSFVYGFISCQRPHVILWLQISYHISNRNYSTVHTHINLQYIPRNMHTVFALLCFVVVIHWLIFPYPSGLLHWHCGNVTIAPVPAILYLPLVPHICVSE